MNSRVKARRYGLISAVLAATLGFALILSPLRTSLESLAYDGFFALRGDRAVAEDVVIIAIDEASFQELESNWPWPRSTHARLIEALFAAGAGAVVLDLIFADPGTNNDDAVLQKALNNYGPIVLATDEEQRQTDQFSRLISIRPLPLFLTPNVTLGSAALPVDRDGFVRRLGLPNRTGEPSLATAAVQQFGRGNVLGPASSGGINFTGPPGQITQYSYYQALEPERFLPQDALQDKLVFVGLITQSEVLDQSSSRDAYPTPFTRWGAAYTNGVEIHAQAAQTLLAGSAIRFMPRSVSLPLSLAFGLLAVWLMFRFTPQQTLPVLAAGCLSVFAFAWWLFSHQHYFLPWSTLLLPTLVVAMVSPIVHYLIARQERNFIHKAFSAYLAAPVVKQLMDKPELLRLGGSRGVGSVLFLDLQGFTAYAEKRDPENVVEELNRYLGGLSEIAIEEGGLIDKFIGDAMMVVWGAPLPDAQHAERACRTALKMQAYMQVANAVEQPRQDQETQDASENTNSLQARIGIHSGEFVAGNIGGDRKFDYTVIGDTVNLAARLEAANKQFETKILISAATREALQAAGQGFSMRKIDTIQVKGRAQSVVVFELVAN